MTGKHGNARPFPCMQCDRTYKWRDALAVHVANAHGVGGVATFPCTVLGCGHASSTRDNLKTHVRQRHLLDRPHVCAFPGCSFAALFRCKLLSHQKRMRH